MKQSNRPLFYVIAILIPFILLGSVELVLRAVGYGQTVPLFVESDVMPGYLQPNPHIIKRYFPADTPAPDVSPDTVFFSKHKAPGSFRIVIQGGSTAAGFPYGRFGSPQGMLEQRFKRTYPNKNIEIINTAMAAVNTYTLLDFVDEILEIEPDLVLVYSGHNEYLGIFGAGSAFAAKGGRGPTLAYLLLKDVRLYQLIQSLYQSWSQGAETSQEQGIATAQQGHQNSLMARAAAGKNIPKDSDLFHAGVSQFEGNLKAIVAKYQKHGVPVMLGNLVSNESDLAPLSTTAIIDWNAVKQRPTDTKSLNVVTGEPAAEAYLKAYNLYQEARFDVAKAAFQQARDLDQLRFRAPSEFNQIINTISQYEGVTLVDVDMYFRQHAPNGIVGNTLMLEHVHPTLQGYFYLAEAFFEQIVKSNLLGKPAHIVSATQAWQDVPVTELDKRWAELKISKLLHDYPFQPKRIPLPPFKPQSEIDFLLLERSQGADWLEQQQKLIALYLKKEQWRDVAKVKGIVSDALINSGSSANLAAAAYRSIGDISLATFYQDRSLRLDPGNVQYSLNQAQHYFMSGALDDSLNILLQAKDLAPADPKIDFFIGKVKQARSEQKGE